MSEVYNILCSIQTKQQCLVLFPFPLVFHFLIVFSIVLNFSEPLCFGSDSS